MNWKLFSISLLVFFISLGIAVADKNKQGEEANIEVVGIIQAIEEDFTGKPTAIELKKESHWLIKPFKKLLGQEAETYKVSLDNEMGKNLLGLIGRRVKALGTLKTDERGKPLFHVKKYESLIELIGMVKRAKATGEGIFGEEKTPQKKQQKQQIALEFHEKPQAMFKYRDAWTLRIQGEQQKELMKVLDKKIWAEGTITDENETRTFEILRFSEVENIVCIIKSIERKENGEITQAKLREKNGKREFELELNEKGKEMLNAVEKGAEVEIECAIEDKVNLKVISFETLSSPEKKDSFREKWNH